MVVSRIRSLPAPLLALALVLPSAGAVPAAADELQALRDELVSLRDEYESRLAALEAKLATLEAAPPPVPAPVVAPPTSRAETAPGTYFNPAISVIGNFLGVAGDSERRRGPAERRAARVGARLPGGDRSLRPRRRLPRVRRGGRRGRGGLRHVHRAARQPARQGRAHARRRSARSTPSTCTLPWADAAAADRQPARRRRGLGRHRRLARGLIPLPGDTFSEATVQVFGGETEGLFEAPERDDLAYNVHYRVFRDLSRATNLDARPVLGARAERPSDDARTPSSRALDADLPLEAAAHRAPTAVSCCAARLYRSRARAARSDPARDRLVRLRRVPARAALVARRPATSGPSTPTTRRSTTAARR